jgi:hypothetical protein
MRALMISAAAVAALVVACPVRADEAAKKVIDEAIKAHGGAERLGKFKDKAAITKGKMKLFAPIEAEGPIEVSAGDKKFRRDFNFTFMGIDIQNRVVFDGKALYVSTKANDQVTNMTFDKKEDLDALKEAMHSEEVGSLVLLGDKNVELSLIGDDKVGETPVVGVRVSVKDHKDVNMYFDKKTHLLKKVIGRALDFESRMETEQERVIDEYKEEDGLMRPARITINKDGKKFVEIEISEIKHVDKLDDDTFAKPKD